jgi:hypothetical protein
MMALFSSDGEGSWGNREGAHRSVRAGRAVLEEEGAREATREEMLRALAEAPGAPEA